MSTPETPVRYISSDGLEAILAKVVAQALSDYRTGRYCPGHPSARDFLVSAGIVDPVTGAVCWHGHVAPPPRPKHKSPQRKQP